MIDQKTAIPFWDYSHLKDMKLYKIYFVNPSDLGIANNIGFKNKIKCYPNPSMDKVYISGLPSGSLKLEVFNLLGQSLLKKDYATNSKGNLEFSTSSLDKGIYIIKLINSSGIASFKLKKE